MNLTNKSGGSVFSLLAARWALLCKRKREPAMRDEVCKFLFLFLHQAQEEGKRRE